MVGGVGMIDVDVSLFAGVPYLTLVIIVLFSRFLFGKQDFFLIA